jgi:hypothetical protein
MRSFRARMRDNSVPLDMTPMIDCIFLLLVFFILTSRFLPEEVKLAALMPSTGSATGVSPPAMIPTQIRIAITPVGIPESASDAGLEAWVQQSRRNGRFTSAELRVGGLEPIILDLHALSLAKGQKLDDQIEHVHRYIHDALARLELGASSRSQAAPVEIHCFSGLPWSFAILAYDAVRAYEGKRWVENDDGSLVDARAVNFVAPRIRNFSTLEDGKELAEIQSLR